ncbi:hypothetical protein PV325_000597, partial [Microctonus aethiopoides]
LNVHQRSLEAAGLELCAASGSVPQGQPSSAGSVGSAPSPASPRPTPQSRAPLVTISSQPSRTLDDDRSTDVGTATTADDSDDGESRAQYVNANCVVFTHYRGDAASEVEEHFQRALAHDKVKEGVARGEEGLASDQRTVAISVSLKATFIQPQFTIGSLSCLEFKTTRPNCYVPRLLVLLAQTAQCERGVAREQNKIRDIQGTQTISPCGMSSE